MTFISKKMDFIMHEDFIYYNHQSTKSPVKLHLAGISYCDGSYLIERNSQHSVFVFEYVESGRGTLEIGNKIFHPSTNDIYRVPAWQAHRYYSDSQNPWIKHWFNISGRLIEELIHIYGIQDQYLFSNCEEGGEIIRETLSALREKTSSCDTDDFMAQQLLKLIIVLSRHNKRSGFDSVSNDNPLAHKLHAYLIRHTFRPLPSIEQMGREIGRSDIQTIRIFKREFGVTPHRFLLELKLNAASELLNGSARTIKEIAVALGFDDEYYFARIFKKYKGISPGMFRKALLFDDVPPERISK